MNYRFRKACLAIVFSAGAIGSPVLAEEQKSNYVTVGTGMSFTENSDISTTIDSQDYNGTAEFTNSFTGDIGVGRDFGSMRGEFTYGYTSTTSDSVTVSSDTVTATAPLAIDYQIHSIQVGVYKDFPSSWKWKPYAGGSVGFAQINFDDTTTTIDGVDYSFGDQQDNALIYQLKLGISWATSESSDLFVEAGYQGYGSSPWSYNCPAGSTCSDIYADSFGGVIAKAGFRIRYGN